MTEEDSIDAIGHTPNASNDIELANFSPKSTSEGDAPPSYSQATRVPTLPLPTFLHSFTFTSRSQQNSPPPRRRATTWYGELIPILSVVVFFTAVMGIAQSVSYGIYYSNYHYLLPLQDLLIPIVGGGPLQLVLASLAFVCYKIKGRILLAACAVLLFVGILAGLVVPITSLVVNTHSSSDTQSIVNRLLAAPPGVLTSFSEQYSSCSYNIPANDTIYTPVDIVPQYLDQNCRYKAIACNVPINTCTYNYNRAYICSDNSQTQSVQPCNTLARTAYQVNYDWNKVEKLVDAWALGVWGFWFVVFVIFSLRYYGGRA